MTSQEDSSESYFLSDPDVVLMLRVKQDDSIAFGTLMHRHNTPVTRFMKSSVGNQQSAEDLAQKVFLRVYRARKSYRPTTTFTTWLYQIATNVANGLDD